MPDADAGALVITGFCRDELNPPGPLQLKDELISAAALRVKLPPAQSEALDAMHRFAEFVMPHIPKSTETRAA